MDMQKVRQEMLYYIDVDVLKNDYSRFEQKLGMHVGKEVVASQAKQFILRHMFKFKCQFDKQAKLIYLQ